MIIATLALGGVILGATTIAGLLMIFQIRGTTNAADSAKAIFAADAGIESALYQRFKNVPSPALAFANGASVDIRCFDDAGVEADCSDNMSISARSVGVANTARRAFSLTFVGAPTPPPPLCPAGSAQVFSTNGSESGLFSSCDTLNFTTAVNNPVTISIPVENDSDVNSTYSALPYESSLTPGFCWPTVTRTTYGGASASPGEVGYIQFSAAANCFTAPGTQTRRFIIYRCRMFGGCGTVWIGGGPDQKDYGNLIDPVRVNITVNSPT